jgi:hypothetical protein
MRAQVVLCAIALSFAIGASEVCAAGVAPAGPIIQTASDHNSGHAIHDLGLAPPTANSNDPTPTPSSASTVSSADATPVPELPIWAMMLLCFVGLGIAKFKKGRKDRLSPGIE